VLTQPLLGGSRRWEMKVLPAEQISIHRNWKFVPRVIFDPVSVRHLALMEAPRRGTKLREVTNFQLMCLEIFSVNLCQKQVMCLVLKCYPCNIADSCYLSQSTASQN
jgi:hypothetical protein